MSGHYLDFQVPFKDNGITGQTPFITMAMNIYAEAGGEPVEGKIAVANVVRNRVNSNNKPLFGKKDEPDLWKSVILRPWQFSWTTAKDINTNILVNRMWNLQNYDLTVFKECFFIGFGIMNGFIKDNTGGAKFYYATYIQAPSWALQKTFTKQIGKHKFFK